MQNLRDKILNFFDDVSCRAGFFFHRLRTPAPKSLAPRQEIIRGTSHSIIVVTPPDPEIFREAMFILQDDYMRSSRAGKEELLRQARDAAEEYTLHFVPPVRSSRPWLLYLLPAFTGALGFLAARWI